MMMPILLINYAIGEVRVTEFCVSNTARLCFTANAFKKILDRSSGTHLRYKSNSSCASLPASRILRRLTPWQILFELGQDKRISLNIVRISLLNKYDSTSLYMRSRIC